MLILFRLPVAAVYWWMDGLVEGLARFARGLAGYIRAVGWILE